MPTSLITHPRPGTFRATCTLALPQPYADLTPAQLERAEVEHWTTFWDKTTETSNVYVPCHFDTTDRRAYAEHMKAHKKRAYTGETWPWARSIGRPWTNGLGLKPEGKPFKASTKALAAAVETCPHCGLIAEVGGESTREADLLWWREHLHGCSTIHRTQP